MHWVRSLYSRARRPRPRSFFLCDPDTNTMAVSSLAILTCGMVACAVDVDHFISARSLKFQVNLKLSMLSKVNTRTLLLSGMNLSGIASQFAMQNLSFAMRN